MAYSLKENVSTFDDILSLSKLEKQRVLDLIDVYQIPPFPNDNYSVIENRNLSSLSEIVYVLYGITIDKCIVKSFPTSRVFKKDEQDIFNRLNQTALHINTSILVLHHSLDKKWCFIVSEIYNGWIESDKVVLVDFETFKENLYKENYVTIIDPLYIYDKLYFDMGTKLKCDSNNIFLYTLNGYIKIDLPKSAYVKGCIPLSKESLYRQAFKYLNFPYNWGDDLDKVDCSSFIRNIFLSCGVALPRDTKDILKYLKHDENFIVSEESIQILHFKGHIALYLFTLQNRHYFIHANWKHMKVTVDYLNSSYLDTKDILAVSHIKQAK